tara:strand:+ start:1728 stop:2507 length:780 start_codon:yes stop_codon:yes gene_type:complete
MKELNEQLNILIKTFKELRNPESGCPWDREQTFKSIASCSIEEAYEVADAIEREDFDSLKSELGDLLFQVIFHAEMASEKEIFDLEDVIFELNDKLTRRHPHVFEDGSVSSAQDSLKIWEDIKAQERKEKKQDSLMDDVPVNLPSLSRAKKLQKRAARVGFDWQNSDRVFDKIDEEILELKNEKATEDKERISEEIGDIFFTLVNLTRHYDLDPEDIIRKANLKFEMRFRKMEQLAEQMNERLDDMTLEQLEIMWQKVK